ncbi:MAG: hypothetical protein M9898_07280 [Chitinophagaceae bacterium]|nr:hypothetical protein [Chitinophagaceae bacterium]
MKPHVEQPAPLFGKTDQRYEVVVKSKEGISAGDKAGNFFEESSTYSGKDFAWPRTQNPLPVSINLQEQFGFP